MKSEQTKSVQIKCRVEPEYKKTLIKFAVVNNTSVSSIIKSSVSTYMSYCDPNQEKIPDNYALLVMRNLLLNEVYNRIWLRTDITDETKNILKEVLTDVK